MNRFLRFFHNLRIERKLLLSYLAVVLVPLLMWSVYSYRQTDTTLREQVESGFRDICSNAVMNLSNKFHRIETAFSTVTTDSSIGQILNRDYTSNYQKYYDVAQKLDPTVNTLRMLNPEILRVDVYTRGSLKSARESFHDLETILEATKWLSLANDAEALWMVKGERLYLMRQVFDINRLSDFSLVVLELDYQSMFCGGISSELQNYGILVEDAEGAVLYRSDVLSRDFGQTGMDAGQLFELSEIRQDLLFQSQTIAPTDWTLAVYMDANTTLMPPQKAFRSMLLILLFSTLLLFLVIPLFSHTMVKRIEVLNDYLACVVKNDFREDISSLDQDEIGGIINSVGMMVQETRTLISEVYESRLQQREAEIKALQSQINPHFLYNTLSAINWQAIKSGNPGGSQIATALSTFYRATLNQGSSITTVARELETTKAYLDIQLSIHENSFDVEYAVSANVLEYNMPNIILQPIVENAIEHGVDMKEDGERGRIRIDVQEERDDIIFKVTDNGPGIHPETVREVLVNEKKGYGVKNVNERLKLFFDKQYGLAFQPADPSGTCVSIRIPKYVEFGIEGSF